MRQLRRAASGMRPAMKEVAGYLEQSTKRRFFTKVAPDGSTWARLSTATQRRRLKKGKRRNDKLVFSGRLLRSIRSDSTVAARWWALTWRMPPPTSSARRAASSAASPSLPGRYKAGAGRSGAAKSSEPRRGRSASAPRAAPRAAPFPGATSRARPFFGLSARDRNEIGDIIRRHLERATE